MPKLSEFKITKEAVDALPATDAVYFDSELKGFGLRVKNGRKTYIIQYRNRDGRSCRLTLGQHGALTPKEARVEARKHLGQVATGSDPVQEARQRKLAETVEELCVSYMIAVRNGLILGKGGKPKKASTIYTDEGRIKRHIVPLLGKRKVRDVTTPDINKFLRDVMAGKTADDVKTGPHGRAIVEGGAGTAARTVGLLGGIFSFAVSEGIIDRNPCQGVKRPADKKAKVRLTPDHYKAFGAALRKSDEDGEFWQVTTALRAIALSGCRYTEITKLQPRELDAEGHALRLQDTKTGESVRPLGQAAIDVLKPRVGNTHYVIYGVKSPEGPYSGLPKALKRVLKNLPPHSKKDFPPLTLKGLRHSYASVAGDLGYSEITIAALIGHSSASVTGRYIHHLDATLIAAADTVSASIWNFMEPA
ncbi:site-specific integrase [Asticcacaulis sp. AND118]|uniref:tyrosine-type recombinase/integrase n=1 Tax=Asticcacaulis sp. AND118 TaxID=2840468 RepID=UPI001CFF7EB5|nr:integrase arm-type DNA-binding domain-containing protein [Asticcacaulis sp. AND118]UDF05212.1 integrase arm-type DNA-binding domain-containing protein [Asticcacaulis sp. AND118]